MGTAEGKTREEQEKQKEQEKHGGGRGGVVLHEKDRDADDGGEPKKDQEESHLILLRVLRCVKRVQTAPCFESNGGCNVHGKKEY